MPASCVFHGPRTHNTVGENISRSLSHAVVSFISLTLLVFCFIIAKSTLTFFNVFVFFSSFFAIVATKYELAAFHGHIIKITITNIQCAYSMPGHVFIYID